MLSLKNPLLTLAPFLLSFAPLYPALAVDWTPIQARVEDRQNRLQYQRIMGLQSSTETDPRLVYPHWPLPRTEPGRISWRLREADDPYPLTVQKQLLNASTTQHPFFLGTFIPGRPILVMSDPVYEVNFYEDEPKTAIMNSQGRVFHRVQGYTGLSASRVVSADGSKLLLLDNSRSRPNRAILYSVSATADSFTNAPLTLEGEHDSAQVLGALSPKGTIAATADRNEGLVLMRSAVTGTLLSTSTFKSGGEFTDLQISPDDKTLAINGWLQGPQGITYVLGIKRIQGPESELKIFRGGLATAFGPYNDRIAIAGENGYVMIARVGDILLHPNIIAAREPHVESIPRRVDGLSPPNGRKKIRRLHYSIDGLHLFAELEDGSWWKSRAMY